MTIRIANWIQDSIVDGPGLRFSLFTQGCLHHCPGCHNPTTHDPDGGRVVDISTLVTEMKKNPLLSGLTITGGEPMLQPQSVLTLLREAKALGLDVIIYSGYTYEELRVKQDSSIEAILIEADYLIDGRFILQERTFDLAFRGSRNQRIIHLKATKEQGKIITTEL
jgi:anaerobic ribonucleoside-triphosphate reductase activating protein